MLSFASDFRPLFWAFIRTGAFRPAWFKRSQRIRGRWHNACLTVRSSTSTRMSACG